MADTAEQSKNSMTEQSKNIVAGQSKNILEIRGLKTHFYTRRGVVPAVDGIDIDVPTGEVVGIVGESGCGKSMTAMSVMQLLQSPGRIVTGSIRLAGENLVGKSKAELCKIRGNQISMIFQEPMTSLNPVFRVGAQVSEAVILHQGVSRAQAKEKTLEVFRQVGIPEPERRYRSYPHQLSGGLRQRVMIGMALVCNPLLMIADEPTTALDVTIEAQILSLMRRLQREKGMSIVMITHNLGVVAELCSHVYVMYAGRIMEQADVNEIFKNPLHPYTSGLLRSIPTLNRTEERLFVIRGMVPNLLKLPAGCRFRQRCDRATAQCAQGEPELYDAGNGHRVRCFLYSKGDNVATGNAHAYADHNAHAYVDRNARGGEIQ